MVTGEKLNMPKYARKRRKQQTSGRIQSTSNKPTKATGVESARVASNHPGTAPRTFSNELERHLQIRKELKTVGLIGGPLLVILIILALILR